MNALLPLPLTVRGTREREGAKAPYTLNPKPYTLHPTPYTLHPTPYTINPKP